MIYPIQIDELLARVSGNREFVIRMLELFFESSDDRLSALQAEFNTRNYSEVAEQTHKLKGLVGNLSINKALPILKDLNTMAVEKNDSQIESLLGQLKDSITEARQFFNDNPSLKL
jgi:HPt (histidine-containing phosphotransfer) domain-containing protein